MTARRPAPVRSPGAAGLALCALLAAGLPALSQTAEDFPSEALALLDTNADDAISPEEIEAFIPRLHAAMDTNEDGRLEVAEAAVALSPKQIAGLDADGDGAIAVEELGPVLRADFAAADRDGNGLVD